MYEITQDINVYEQDLKQDLAYFELTHQNYISKMTWALDHGALNSFVNYEIHEAKTNYIEITDSKGAIIANAGEKLSSSSIIHQFDLTYNRNDTAVFIGHVLLGGNIPSYTESIQSRWKDLFFVNGILVSIIFSTSFLLFYKQVLVKLSRIKEFAEHDSLETTPATTKQLILKTEGVVDEITLLTNSIIERKQRLKTEFVKRLEAEKELTEKNAILSSEIEERKLAEKQLEQSQAKFQAIFSSITDAVIFVDTDRQVLMINPAFSDIFGYNFDEIQGMTTRFLYVDEAAFREQGKLRYHKEADYDQPLYEIQYRRKDGSCFTAETLGVPVRNAAKQLVGFVCIIRDVTDRKRSEEEKATLENRLRQAQKMEAIGTLAGGIAHDFNNILAAILGYAELVKDDCAKNSRTALDIEEVIKAGNRAKNLVRQILSFSRQAETECISFIPANLVKEALKMLRQTIPSTIEIHQDIDSDTSQILADPTQINQIIMNLCTNAYHALEDTGGKIEVSLKEVVLTEQGLQHQPDINPGAFIQITVKDSGPGIPVEIQDKIFDPFFTTKNIDKGTGMGLSIVHGIVTNMGGFITLNNGGIGSTFNVFLPIDNTPPEPIENIIHNTPVSIGKERILFIDDEESIGEMSKKMLERAGYQVTTKTSGQDALEIFKRQPDRFDLIITDQTMPGMTGTELSSKVLEIRPDIPIILCTGYSSIISKEEAEGIGIKEFALKPLSKKNFTALIHKVLNS